MELQNIFLLLFTLKWTTLARPQENLPAPTTCLGGDVFYNNTCMPLLLEGSCGGPTDWLIRDDNGKLQCEPMPCYNEVMRHRRYHRTHNVLFNGTCVPLGSTNLCPLRMNVQALDNGKGYCDCEGNYLVFWANKSHTTSHEGGCHYPYRRGPCSEHQVLYIPPVQQGGRAECRYNPCDDYHIPIEELPNGDVTFSATGKCKELYRSSCGHDGYEFSTKVFHVDGDMNLKCGNVDTCGLRAEESTNSGRQPLKPFNRHQCNHGSRRRSAGQCQPTVAAVIGG